MGHVEGRGTPRRPDHRRDSGAIALIAFGTLKLVGGWLEDAGYTEDELDRVALACEQRVEERASEVGLNEDDFYDRCERSMKIQIDPQRWLD